MQETRWADVYLGHTPVKNWDILDYLSSISDPEKHSIDELMRSWIKALGEIIDNDTGLDAEKLKAKKLFHNYRSSTAPDRTRAKEWSSNLGTQPAVLIQNTFTSSNGCSVNLNTLGDDDDRRVLRKRKPSNREIVPKTKRQKKPIASRKVQRINQLQDRFTISFNTMKDANKWLLPSGQFLEDIIHEHFRKAGIEHSAHSWVIDLDDAVVEGCFGELDWIHICAQMPSWPDLDPLVGESIVRFEEVQTPDDLSDALESTSYFQNHDEDKGLDSVARRLKYLGPRWVDSVMRQLLPIYENPANFKSPYNLENWFIVNIWSSFLDRGMATVKDIHLSRGESLSMSTSDRKNDHTKPGSRKKIGHRYDGVLRFKDVEIGAVEHAREYQGENSRKWISDTLKLMKVLHDMLVRMEPHVYSEEAFKSIQVVGLITAGLHCQPMRMKYAQGYVCILGRQERREVPTVLDEAGDLFELLLDFWGIRTLVQDCQTTLEKLKSNKRKQVFTRIKSSPAVPPRVPLLFPSIETDATSDEEEI